MKTPTLKKFAFALCLLALIGRPATAQTTQYWNPGQSESGQTDGSDTWSATGLNWYDPASGSNPVTWDNHSTDTAIIGSPTNSTNIGSQVVTVAGTVDVGTLDMAAKNGGYSIQGSGTLVGNNGVLTLENGSANWSSAGYFFSGINFADNTINFTSTNGYGIKIINSTINNGQAVTFNLGTGTDTGNVVAGGNGFNIAKINLVVNNGWTFSPFESNDLASATITGQGNGKEGNNNDFFLGAIASFSSKTGTAGVMNVPTITLNGDALIANGDSNGGAGLSILNSSIGGTGNLFLAGSQFRQYATGPQSKTTVASLILNTTNSTYTGATIITENTMNENQYEEGTGLGYQTVALGVNNALSTNSELVLGVKSGTAAITGAMVTTYTSNGVFDMAGFNQSVTGLATGAGTTASANFIGNNSGAGVSTLTITGSTTPTTGFGGTIQDNLGTAGGTVALAVTGGSLKLNGLNTYTGGTSVSGGTLTAGVAGTATSGAFGVGPLAVSGGLVNLNNFSQTLSALILSGNGGLTFGTDTVTALNVGTMSWTGGGGSLLTFNLATGANGSNAINLTGGLTTSGSGFDIALTGGTTGMTYDLINGVGTGITAGEFTETSGLVGEFAIQNDDLVFIAGAIPEPSTWLMFIVGLGVIGWAYRSRVRA